ncbi:MAG: leucine-rich repeat domain-containing protein, partial [Burkholderiales bacterium]|nr:leucine-rich repeat domain-containing protein [Burkholderiales bacterium]
LDQQIRTLHTNTTIRDHMLEIHDRFKGIFSGSSTRLDLKETFMGDNLIKLLKDLKSISSVTQLNLSDNEITDIEDLLENKGLNQLTLLDLGNNDIKKIPSSLTNLTNLTTLDLSFNPLELQSIAQVLESEKSPPLKELRLNNIPPYLKEETPRLLANALQDLTDELNTVLTAHRPNGPFGA